MGKAELARMEGEPPQRIALRAVFLVPGHRMACLGELDADLVAPPRLQTDLHQRIGAERFDRLVMGDRRAGGPGGRRAEDLRLRLVEMALQRPFRRLGRAFDDGVIPLADPVPALLQLPLRRRGLHQHQQPRGVAVEPVDDEDPLIPSPVAEEAGHLEIGGLLLPLVGGDGEEAGGLLDHQDGLVLVMDTDSGGKLRLRRGEFPRPHRHPIAGPERMVVARLPGVVD